VQRERQRKSLRLPRCAKYRAVGAPRQPGRGGDRAVVSVVAGACQPASRWDLTVLVDLGGGRIRAQSSLAAKRTE
jgi:hypothetical protein